MCVVLRSSGDSWPHITNLCSIQVLERLQKAERLLKVSKQKDYYKVLGVSRDADTKTVKKAL